MEFESSTKSTPQNAVESKQSSENQFGLSVLASTLAHEIRNPLQVIRLQLDAAERGGSLKTALISISESLHRLEGVVERVQKLSQSYRLQITSINIRDLIDETLSSLHFWLAASGITVHTHYDWEGEPCTKGDSELIKQVMLNLIMNAVQAMPQGGVLSVRVSEALEVAQIEVIDSGIGMSPETLKSVGTPFFTTKAHGHGLGVAFCRTIAALHGGHLTIESEVSKGTNVTLTLQKELPIQEEPYDH